MAVPATSASRGKRSAKMNLELLTEVDAAIRDALSGIERQRAVVEEFSARGRDVRHALSLLSSLLMNLKRLERQRRELAAEVQGVVAI